MIILNMVVNPLQQKILSGREQIEYSLSKYQENIKRKMSY